MKDLLEQLMQLNEAPVKPGERKGISFKLKRLDKISSKLQQYKSSMGYMQAAVLPDEMKSDMKTLQDKLNVEIEKVNSAYQAEYEKSTVNDRPVKMDNLFKALAKNCKDIIKVYKELNRNNFDRQKFLFRGIRSSDDALYGKPFDARKPKDSSLELHELVNGTINSLGFEANRENAMFVTGDRSQASGYGNSLYIMFPVDGFTFTWSKTVKDLVLDNSKRQEMIDKEVVRELREMVKKAKSESKEPENFPIYDPDDLFYSGYNYDRDYQSVSRAIDRGILPKEAQDLLDNVITDKSIQEHFQFTNQDLFGAILSEKEIYIRGNYYAVNMEHSRELFKFLESMDTDNVKLPESFGEVPNILDTGDIVKILTGIHQGKLGTITYVYSDKYEVFITQKTGDITIPKDEVELYQLPDGTVPIFQKDDKIIVTDPDSRLYGTVASVIQSLTNGKVEIADENSTYNSVYKNQLENYTPEREQEIQKDLETRPPVIGNNDDVVVSDPENEFYGERGRVNFIYSSGTIEVNLPKKNTYIDFQPNQLVLLKNAPPELLKKSPGEYHLGDEVNIIDGEYKGYSGKVTYLYSNGDKAEVDIPGIKQVDVPLMSMEHVGLESKPDTSETVNGIKVGDTVQVTSNESSYYGQVGEVIEVKKSPTGKDSIRIKNDTYPSGWKTFVGWVEKVDTPQQTQQPFKKNDKFKVKEKSFSVDGSIATVIDGPDSDGDYQAVTDDGKTIFTSLFQMEKIEDTQPSFSVGDTVKIIDKSSGYSGMVGKISDEPDSDGDYTVTFDEDGEEEWTYAKPDEMEKVEKPQADKTFSEGDTVKLNGPSLYDNSSYIGYTGTITSVSEDGMFAGVRIDGADEDTILTYDVSNLSRSEKDDIDGLTWEPESEVKSPIKIGDTVKNIKDGHPHYGQTGEVKTVYSSGNVGLVYSDGTQAVDPSKWLEKVTAPETSTAPTQAQFKKGDRIEVVGQFPSLIGETGTVVQISPNYDFVSVQLDNNTSPSSFPSIALKKIDATDPTEFHLGDMVEVTNDNLDSYGQKGKVTDMDVGMLVIQDSSSGEVFFAKKASVKKIG